jgi:hypothetical protein
MNMLVQAEREAAVTRALIVCELWPLVATERSFCTDLWMPARPVKEY